MEKNIIWTPEFAYAVGLIVADGCLSKDGRHIILTSKDIQLLNTFNACISAAIGIGPAKSKTISRVDIPDAYFFDYLRGYFDGDGSSFSYFDPIWKNSLRFYISFAFS